MNTNPSEPTINVTCPSCGKPMKVRRNKETGHEFLGCSQWPTCTETKPMPEYVAMLRAGATTLPGFDL